MIARTRQFDGIRVSDELLVDRQLRDAASKGNVANVCDLLENEGACINSADVNGWTALHCASLYNSPAVVLCLIQKGANVNQVANDGCTALQVAAVNNHFSVVTCLLQHGADLNVLSSMGETVPQLVKKYNHKKTMDVIKLFIATSVSLPPSPSTPVHATISDFAEWQITETTVQTPEGIPQPVTETSSKTIDKTGGCIHTDDVFVVVAEDTVSKRTRFFVETYSHPQSMSPVDEEKGESLLSSVVRLNASQATHKFKKPVQLFLPVEAPLKSSDYDSGWLLELKRSESSPEGKQSEWQTVLQLNTNTRKVMKWSPCVDYNLEKHSVSVNRFSDYVWKGLPFGRRSPRDICYTVFGKQVQQHKWTIAVHLVPGLNCKQLSKSLLRRSYIELACPNHDKIGRHGNVHLTIDCHEPWKMGCDRQVCIPTNRIWNIGRDASCYHEVIVEDTMECANTLECVVKASFQQEEQGKFVDNSRAVTLVVAYPLNNARSTTAGAGVGQNAIDKDEVDSSSHCGVMAALVRDKSNCLGCYWMGWSDIPVDVIRDVIDLVADHGKARILADSLLPDFSFADKVTREINESKKIAVRTVLESWIKKKGDKASLGNLFRAMHKAGLFYSLKHKLESRMENQKPHEVGLACYKPDEIFDAVEECGSSRWLQLGYKMGFTDDEVQQTVQGHLDTKKLYAIYSRKRGQVGEYRAAARLLAAAQTIRIMGCIGDVLPGVEAALAKSCSI